MVEKYSRREICVIVDAGYWASGPEFPEDYLRTQVIRRTVESEESVYNILWAANLELDVLGFDRHDHGMLATVSILRSGTDPDEYRSGGDSVVQNIGFVYGKFGELNMLPLPYEMPARISIDQIQEVVDRHFPGFDASKIVVRYQGGFGGAGDALFDEMVSWMLSESASLMFATLIGWIGRGIVRIFGARGGISRNQRYAQIARDMISRHVSSTYALREWLDTRTIWKLQDVMIAIAIPKKLAMRLLSEAGYANLGWGRGWVLGSSDKSRRNRELWLLKELHGYGWSPLD